MSEVGTNQKQHTLKLTCIARLGLLNVYQLRNVSSETIVSPFSDHASSALTFSASSTSIKSLTGKSKKRWLPVSFINCDQFYSITLKAGQRMLMLHARAKKSAGYLTSSVNSNQASYVYTYTHSSDPHQKHSDSQPEEESKCVI